MGDALANLGTAIADEARHQFTVSLQPNTAVALAGEPARYDLESQNTGSVATTYDFSVSGLPDGIAASFNKASVTLQPGEQLLPGPDGVELTLTQSGNQ